MVTVGSVILWPTLPEFYADRDPPDLFYSSPTRGRVPMQTTPGKWVSGLR